MGTSGRYPSTAAAEYIIYSNLYRGKTACDVGGVTTQCNSEPKWLEAWGSLGAPDGYDESLEFFENQDDWSVADWAENLLKTVYTEFSHPGVSDDGYNTGGCAGMIE